MHSDEEEVSTPLRNNERERRPSTIVLQMQQESVEIPVFKRTPTHALVDFDGNVSVVRAQHVRRVMCGRKSLTFFAHMLALMLALITGLVMMIVIGYGNSGFSVWSSIFALGVGGFLPNPKLKTETVLPAVIENGGGGPLRTDGDGSQSQSQHAGEVLATGRAD